MCAVHILRIIMFAYIVCIYAISHYLSCTWVYHTCGCMCKCVKPMVLAWFPEHCQHTAGQQLSPLLTSWLAASCCSLNGRHLQNWVSVTQEEIQIQCGFHWVHVAFMLLSCWKPVRGILAGRRHLQVLSVCPIPMKTGCPQHSRQSWSTHTPTPISTVVIFLEEATNTLMPACVGKSSVTVT